MKAENRWSWVAAAALAAAVVAINLGPISDPDTWWHLKTGELIWKTGSIPRVDPFSYTIAGRPWVTFEWLSQLLFFAAYAAGGAATLTGFKALVAAAAFLAFFRLGRSGVWAAILLSAAAWGCGPWAERPQIFDALFLGLILAWLEEDAPVRRQWPRVLALQALWANLHGGAALLGVAAAACAAAADLFRGRKTARLGLAAACAAALLMTPHGFSLFGQLGRTLTFPGRELIAEWQPLADFLNRHGLFFAAAVGAAAVSRRESLALLLMTAALGALSTWAIRWLPLFELAAAALCARALEERLPLKAGPRAAAGAAAAAFLAAAFAPGVRGLGLKEYPQGAAAFLERESISGRMFNEYNLGGYLIWKERKVFVDGRNVEYGPDFIRDAMHWYDPAVWARLDARWNFDYAVVENAQAYRTQVLDASKVWALCFWDDASLVYLRREPANGAAIPRSEYKRLRPNELTYGYLAPLLKDKKSAAEIMAELERAVKDSPQNDNARLMKAYALGMLGRASEALPEIEAAVAHSPRKPGPLITLGWWYAANGDRDAARSAYDRALALARAQEDKVSEAYIQERLSRLQNR